MLTDSVKSLINHKFLTQVRKIVYNSDCLITIKHLKTGGNSSVVPELTI